MKPSGQNIYNSRRLLSQLKISGRDIGCSIQDINNMADGLKAVKAKSLFQFGMLIIDIEQHIQELVFRDNGVYIFQGGVISYE